MSTDTPLQICLVGAGPRGTSVLERLCANANLTEQPISVHVVDSSPVGSGSVWRTSQSTQLLMNTVAAQVSLYTDASVLCVGPIVPGPSLYEWARMLATGRLDGGEVEYPPDIRAEADTLGPDDYPTRACYGHYLRWVFGRLTRTAPENVTIAVHEAAVVALDDTPDGRQAVTFQDGAVLAGLDAVVLALGHSPLARDAQQDRDRAHARTHGLFYGEPANPADVDLTPIRPAAPLVLRGLGLNFFDYMALLTIGRGGRFEPAGDGVRYLPSGREPVLYAGSRRGIPYHGRGENQKGVFGRHRPLFLTADVMAGLRARADAGDPVSFRDTVWPLVDREVRAVYHHALIREQHGEPAAAAFLADLAAPGADAAREPELLTRYGVAAEQRWRWDPIERPQGGRRFADRAEFRTWLLDYLRQDVREARLGNVRSPLKAALDVLRDLRNEIRLVVDHGGITGGSYRDELEAWYNPLNAFCSIGPPVRRIEEMIALIEAGVLHVVGPGIRIDAAEGCFVLTSKDAPGPPVRAAGLIEARLPDVHLRRSANPLLRYLLATGQARPYRLADAHQGEYESGGVAVTRRPYRLVDHAGTAHPARYAFGVPTEGVHWVTAAGIRPGVGSVTLEDADAIARAVLGIPPPGTGNAPDSAVSAVSAVAQLVASVDPYRPTTGAGTR
ncbi:MAG TPA: FAD/NAD(P)-binding protein [Actinocrinis sp.]|nr:FAD/NAD(P)-binding protein [Actinocrinis sp.]